MLLSDAKRRQAETGGGDAGYRAAVGRAYVAAVLDQAGFRVGLLPKELKTGLLQVFQKLVVFRRQTGGTAESADRASLTGAEAPTPGASATASGGKTRLILELSSPTTLNLDDRTVRTGAMYLKLGTWSTKRQFGIYLAVGLAGVIALRS